MSLPRFFLIIIAALLGGIVGAAILFYLLPAPTPVVMAPARVLVPVQTGAGALPRIPVASVAVASSKALKPVVGGSVVADTDIIGAATVLTSDGWLVTDRSVLDGLPNPVILLPGGVARPVTAVVPDPETHLTFFHVEAKNMDVVAFGDSAVLVPGTPLFAVAPGKRLVPLGLASAHIRPHKEAKDAVRVSSAVAERLAFNTSVPKQEIGSGLVTERGALVGIIIAPEKGQDGARFALPIEAVSHALREIVRGGTVHRPSLGMSTVDVSELASREESFSGVFGAVVVSIEARGPAAVANVRVGDRVTVFGGEALDGSRLLSDLLASYRIGESVAATLVRDGAEQEVEFVVASSQ